MQTEVKPLGLRVSVTLTPEEVEVVLRAFEQEQRRLETRSSEIPVDLWESALRLYGKVIVRAVVVASIADVRIHPALERELTW